MRARLTYVPLEVAERFEGFIIQRDEQVLDAVRAKTKDLNLKDGAQDMFNPGMIIETNEADDDKYLQEFELQDK